MEQSGLSGGTNISFLNLKVLQQLQFLVGCVVRSKGT